MRPLLLLLSIPLLILATTTSAHAAPTYNYYWGTNCWSTVPPVNMDFDGPRVYQQVLSVQGLPYGTTGYEVLIHIGPAIPDCWNFLPDGCATIGGYEATVSTSGTTNCPFPLATGNDLPSLTVEEILCRPGQACSGYGVRLSNFYLEPSIAHQGFPQLLGVLNWDLGSATAEGCAGAADALCFHVVSVGFLLSDRTT